MDSAGTKTKIFIISAPSGSGKTTLCRKLLSEMPKLVPSVSFTTRPPRENEKRGVDYHFVSEARFKAMIGKRQFLEHEENFGRLYGTSKRLVADALKKNTPVLLNIDVKGAMKVKSLYPKRSVLIFIKPPSIKELRERLRARMADAPHAISKRLRLARREIAYKKRYDYVIVNDDLSSAYKRLKKIISAEMRA